MKRAACYVRVSTEDQAEYSPDSQLREMREYAARCGLTILEEHIYVDEGISGRTALSRPQFQNMISAAKSKPRPFDCVLLYKFSRFARSREDSVVYKSLLRRKCGVEVVSITEPLDPDNKMSIIMEAFIEAMDEYYSINLSEDVRRTMTEKALRGELQSSPAFGYRAENNVLVPVEAEARLVKDIFAWFISGDGCSSIARRLNAMGAKTHRGNPFENRAVEYILRNPVYIGKLRWNPLEHSARDFDNPHIILQTGRHPPLIDPETWLAAQARVRQLKEQGGKYRHPPAARINWLSGLLICADCGRPMVKCSSLYWRCGAYSKGACRTSQHVSDERIRAALFTRLEEDIGPAAGVCLIKSATDPAQSERKLLQRRLDAIPQKLRRASDAYQAGTDSLEEYRRCKELLLGEAQALKARLRAPDGAGSITAPSPCAFFADPSVAGEIKCRAAHSLFRRIVWDKSKNLLRIEYQVLP